MGIEKPLPLEERDHAAADPFGEPGQVCGGERPGREHRRPVGAVRSRQEDAVGDGCVEMGVDARLPPPASENSDTTPVGKLGLTGRYPRNLLPT
jgi:hypothetical protein